MIENTGQVVIVRRIQVILVMVMTIHVLKTNPSRNGSI